MNMKLIPLTFLLSLVLFVQCKKYSNHWLTGEVELVDIESKEKLHANYKLRYYEGYLLGSEEKHIDFGTTGEDGIFKFEKHVNRKDSGFELEVFAGPFYGGFNWPNPDIVRSISSGKHNKITIEIPRSYVMSLTFNNTSCYDETDSLWLVWPGAELENAYFSMEGCVSGYQPEIIYYSAMLDTATYISISKKNGVYDTLFHHYDMEHWVINQFELNY